MDEKQEQVYIQGERSAWRSMLQECLKNLGYENLEAQKASWILEREAAIAKLRSVCESFGDNDWDESLHLADIIEKHLARHMDRLAELLKEFEDMNEELTIGQAKYLRRKELLEYMKASPEGNLSNIKIPNEQEILVGGWPGFKVVVPNGTGIHLVNEFLAVVMDWTCVEINKRRPTQRPSDEKPAAVKAAFPAQNIVSRFAGLFSVFRRNADH